MPYPPKSIVHKPWCQKNRAGINGQRIAIVGYSHYYLEGGSDDPELTHQIVGGVAKGELKLAFFTSILHYFEFRNHSDFWPRVTFFNFIPSCIGTDLEKFKIATDAQTLKAKARVLQIISQEGLDKVFVFSRKAWTDFPETIGELGGRRCEPLIPGRSEPSWGEYQCDGRRVMACGFRHPLGAMGIDLRPQVQRFLDMRQS